MLRGIESVARSAGRAWKRARAGSAALTALAAALIGASATALVLEVTRGGLGIVHWPWLAAWLLLLPIAAAVAVLRPIPGAVAASELDRRAGYADRLGTALEFAADPSPMAALQREDAAAFAAAAAPAAAFGVPWTGRTFARLAALLALFLLIGGASLTWRLGPAEPEPEPEPTAADDLLALIEADRLRMEELGDKEAVRLLTDLERTIRQIQAREEELRERVARRIKPEEDEGFVEPELDEPELPEELDAVVDNDLITAEDLERLEESTLEQLRLTDAETDELVSQLFDHSRTAQKLLDEFEYSQKDEIDAAHEAHGDEWTNPTEGTDMRDFAGGEDPVRDAFGEYGAESVDDPSQDIQDVIRRDLSEEGMGEHDLGHDKRESFNQFLQDFVKDVREIVSDAAMGRSTKDKKPGKKNGREVNVDPGDGVADKSNSMEESGFEEMDDSKRHEGEAPSEMVGEGEGPGPEQGGSMKKGPVSEDAMAMKGPAGTGTEAGASGAGTGNPNATGGLAALLDKVVSPEAASQGPLEQALTQLAQGRLPPEQREAVFDRIARHKVQAGPATEADDVVVDYFAEAEELMVSNRDSLPPLFRDYAQSYFEAIKPGSDDQ
ncbi:MAG: hypothetical protein GY898_06440 [Proteobacteria bacterium]|nr:hypothetical protein [Pseudomonadota bacterium]